MKVIVGLGNPGLRFRFSRHNLGFWVIDKLAELKKIKINQKAFHCLLGKGLIGNQDVLLAKPLTYMNLTGKAVAQIVKQTKVKLTDLLIICDDVNLPLGKIRIRPKGSEGGHQGLRSIIEALGSEVFPRLRIGVSMPQQVVGEGLTEYVLGRFNKRELKVVNAALDEARRATLVWVKDGVETAMNKFNYSATQN